MKRTQRLPDGTEETLDGTPEEIIEYDRSLERHRQGDRPKEKAKKSVLLGSDEGQDVIKRLWESIQEWHPQQLTPYDAWRCSICGLSTCHGSHSFCVDTSDPKLIC